MLTNARCTWSTSSAGHARSRHASGGGEHRAQPPPAIPRQRALCAAPSAPLPTRSPPISLLASLSRWWSKSARGEQWCGTVGCSPNVLKVSQSRHAELLPPLAGGGTAYRLAFASPTCPLTSAVWCVCACAESAETPKPQPRGGVRRRYDERRRH